MMEDKRRNLLFIGSNDMVEIINYVEKYKNGLFIEAIPNVYEKLRINLESVKNYGTNYIPINALVTSEENMEYNFNLFNNDSSSSIYSPNPDFSSWWQQILSIDSKIQGNGIREVIKLSSKTINTILKQYDWENVQYDVILDVQGAELEVLKGFGTKNLSNIEEIVVEVSSQQFYSGGTVFEDLDKFLIENGFVPEMKRSNLNEFINQNKGHCDVKYIKG
jgi:FkbM family methyltransferase